MIHEYTLEPALLSSWASNNRDYAEFLREYGLGKPRIMSSFPTKKASKLRSYLLQHSPQGDQSLVAQRYTEMVVKIVESIVVREVLDNLPNEWIEAVAHENNRSPFGAILSSSQVNEKNSITPDTMYSHNSIWNHKNQVSFERTNDGLYSVISNLIRFSTSKIVIVDPYGGSAAAIGFIQFILHSLTNNRLSAVSPSIMIFYKNGNSSPNANHVKQQIVQGLGGVAVSLQLDVFELRETGGSDVFHNRCILSEHGGIMIGHGFGVSGDATHTDEATLMTEEVYQKKWQQFVEQRCFEVVSHS
jgi:hypothetical protein